LSNDPVDVETISAALAKFEEGLKQAQQNYGGPNQRIGILGAITAAMEFVSAMPSLRGHEGPFIKLVHALNDLDEGIVPPLFRVTNRGPGRPNPIENQTLAGLAGCAMQVLMELKYPKLEAGRLVARKLQELGIPIGNSFNVNATAAAKTIAYWRDAAKKGDRDKDDDARIYYEFVRELSAGVKARVKAGDARDTIRREFLEGLGDTCHAIGLPNPTGAEIE
jgi:hypothetical protein